MCSKKGINMHRRNNCTLLKTLYRKSISKYLKMERARILEYIQVMHIDGGPPVGFSADEINSINEDMLLLLLDSSSRVNGLDSRTPNMIIQIYRRAITHLRQIYNDPIPPGDPQFAIGGTVNDIVCLLAFEWSCITTRTGSPTVTSSTTTPPPPL